MWKRFQKNWPQRLQDYSVWSEEKGFFFHAAKQVQQTLNPLGSNFCTTQSWGSLYCVRKLSCKSIKKIQNSKNLRFHSLKAHQIGRSMYKWKKLNY
jgi:hypothetical protein